MSGLILVTGASGFIGRRLVEALRRLGEGVMTHSRTDGDLARAEPNAKDIRHVYHLAARTYVPDSWNKPFEFYETNVLGTVNILEFCRRNGSGLTLLSSYVYGWPKRLPIEEEHPLAALNPYAHSKILAEEAAQFYHSTFGVQLTVVRAFNPYGPGQAGHFLIPSLTLQALSANGDEVIVEDDRPRRDYLFIDDLIELLMATMTRGGGVYNAGSGVSVSVREVANLVIQIAGTGKRLVSRGRERQNDLFDTVADISRARRELHWAPKTNLEKGLQLTIEFMRSAKPPAGDFGIAT